MRGTVGALPWMVCSTTLSAMPVLLGSIVMMGLAVSTALLGRTVWQALGAVSSVRSALLATLGLGVVVVTRGNVLCASIPVNIIKHITVCVSVVCYLSQLHKLK